MSPCFRLLPARGDGFGGVAREADFGESDLARTSPCKSSLDLGGVSIPTSGVPCRLESLSPSRLLDIS